MRFQIRLLPAIGAILFVFLLSTASGHAADPNRFFDLGQPRDLINQPGCWSSEQPDPSRNCDYAQRT